VIEPNFVAQNPRWNYYGYACWQAARAPNRSRIGGSFPPPTPPCRPACAPTIFPPLDRESVRPCFQAVRVLVAGMKRQRIYRRLPGRILGIIPGRGGLPGRGGKTIPEFRAALMGWSAAWIRPRIYMQIALRRQSQAFHCGQGQARLPEGEAGKTAHCGISVASAARFMAEMGHEQIGSK
jgi:hypothetical protein